MGDASGNSRLVTDREDLSSNGDNLCMSPNGDMRPNECVECEGSGSAYIGCGSPLGQDCPVCDGTGEAVANV